jgi:hypothetical protein
MRRGIWGDWERDKSTPVAEPSHGETMTICVKNDHEMNVIGRKHFISLLLNHRNILSGASGGFLLIFLAVVNFVLIGPIFIPAVPRQPHVKDITVVIPNGGVDSSVAAVRSAGFRKIYALSYDERFSTHSLFTSYKQMTGTFGDDITGVVNTTFVVFGSVEAFKVATRLPELPDKPMVIGYSFATCDERRYALIGPGQLENAMVRTNDLKRFHAFAETLKGSFSKNEAFRIFCDLHSLRLLVMPCGKRTGRLPKWETIDVIEDDRPPITRPWDTIPHVQEVWSIRDLI